MSRTDIPTVCPFLDYRPALTGFEVFQDHFGVNPHPTWAECRVENLSPTVEHLRPGVEGLAVPERRHGFRGSTVGRHAPQDTRSFGAIDDVLVLSPAGFSIGTRDGASDRSYRSTLDGSSLERVVLGETNPLSVWRKKRGFCTLGPLHGDGLQAIQRPEEQLPWAT